MIWRVFFVNAAAQIEVEQLPKDLLAKFERIRNLIETRGLEYVREPYVKHLEGKFWEMRMIGRDGIARSIYITASGKRVVVLRTFAKKTQKTPRREFALAVQRAKEIL